MLPALIFSNAWVSLCVAIFSLPYLNESPRPLFYLWPVFVYLNTFLGYAFLHRNFLTQHALSETNPQSEWMFRHRIAMSAAIALHALALFLLIIWYERIHWILYSLPAVFLVLLYKLQINNQEQGLRSRQLIKPLSVSAATIWMCCIVPGFIIGSPSSTDSFREPFLMLADFIFISGIALLFDAHDFEEDRTARIPTLIQTIGIRNIPLLVASLCLASGALSIVLALGAESDEFGSIFASAAFMLVSSVMLMDKPLQRKDPGFGFWFDGLIGLKGFLFIAFS